jgi:hypothetical protein
MLGAQVVTSSIVVEQKERFWYRVQQLGGYRHAAVEVRISEEKWGKVGKCM